MTHIDQEVDLFLLELHTVFNHFTSQSSVFAFIIDPETTGQQHNSYRYVRQDKPSA